MAKALKDEIFESLLNHPKIKDLELEDNLSLKNALEAENHLIRTIAEIVNSLSSDKKLNQKDMFEKLSKQLNRHYAN